MTHAAALVRIFCVPMLLASSAAIADTTKLSEQLVDWHRAATSEIVSAASFQEPLALITSTNVSESIIRELVLLKGQAMLGTPYVYGANGADGVDCSALIQQLFQNAGIELPRTTRDLVHIGKAVSSHSLQPGDLLFYRWRKHGLHVAVYAGDGLAIHASPGERSVVITELNRLWDKHFVGARRVVPEGNL